MNASSQTWTEFLNSEGAVFTANGESQLLRSFGDASPGSESSVENWLTDLADLAVIEASGSECGDFLQAQFCNDCLLYTSPSPRDRQKSRMPSSA